MQVGCEKHKHAKSRGQKCCFVACAQATDTSESRPCNRLYVQRFSEQLQKCEIRIRVEILEFSFRTFATFQKNLVHPTCSMADSRMRLCLVRRKKNNTFFVEKENVCVPNTHFVYVKLQQPRYGSS